MTSGAADTVVRIDALVKRYRRRQAVAGVSLRVGRGELYGLIGADGAGKSSLFKAVAGVLSFEGGTLSVFGQHIASERDAERVKQRIGFMPQGLGLNLYPELSVDENIDFFADLRGVPAAAREERKARLLAMTRLDAFRARPMKQLSGGMKQKLGLGVHPHPRARADRARRADHRRGPAVAARLLAPAARADAGAGHDGAGRRPPTSTRPATSTGWG